MTVPPVPECVPVAAGIPTRAVDTDTFPFSDVPGLENQTERQIQEQLYDRAKYDGAEVVREEGIPRVNDSRFGLASAIWTEDLQDAHEVAAEIEAGTVLTPTTACSTPALAGATSRVALAANSERILDDYTQTKRIKSNLGGAPRF